MEAGRVNGAQRVPDEEALKQLLDWRPELGVVSVYVDMDPGDRGEPWRIELKDRLEEIVEAEQDKHGRRPALAATAERIQERLLEDISLSPSGRCQIGFCEVALKDGTDTWMSAQMHRDETEVVDRGRPYLTPLLELLDEGAPLGVVAVSAERVLLYEWALGSLTDLASWEAELFIPDWRERKARSSPDPARVHGPSASGRDQYEQRLDANRERFLKQVGGLVAERADAHRWRRVLAFGDPHHTAELEEGIRKKVELDLVDDADLVSETNRGRLLERIEAAVDKLNRRRELELVRAALEAAMAPAGRGAVGLSEIEQSLTEGRVRHLLFDAQPREREIREKEDDLVEQAFRTRASITPVEGEAAEMLREHGGVAALLRY